MDLHPTRTRAGVLLSRPTTVGKERHRNARDVLALLGLPTTDEDGLYGTLCLLPSLKRFFALTDTLLCN